jgi:IclR family KDG regulon transcriptional repressor
LTELGRSVNIFYRNTELTFYNTERRNKEHEKVTEKTVDKTLSKGVLLVELLSKRGRGGISELALKTGLTKSNVHRLMQTLCRVGWVRKVEEDNSYELSYKLWEIAQNWISTFDLPRIAGRHLAELAAATQETVHLGILEGGDVVFIVTIDSPQAVRTHSGMGSRAPAYCVATGKAILAFLPPEKAPALPERPTKYASGSILSTDEIEAELERTRRRGYAINRAEWQDQVNGIAAPVYAGSSASVIAAVGVTGPAERMNQTAMRRFAPMVQAAAMAISKAMVAP